MPRCETCHNEYDKAFEITMDGPTGPDGTDYFFTPDTLTVQAGQEVTVRLVNVATQAHRFWVIFLQGMTNGRKFSSLIMPHLPINHMHNIFFRHTQPLNI